MNSSRSLIVKECLDFLLFMESGYVLPKLCKTPVVNRYVFDILVRQMDDKQTNVRFDAAGPFQVTNIFIKDYLLDSDPDEASAALQSMVDVNEHFSQVPLYQLQAVCGFFNRRPIIMDDEINPNRVGGLLTHLARHESRNRLIAAYRIYFGASSQKQTARIDNYIDDYFSKGKFFIDNYKLDGAWDVD